MQILFSFLNLIYRVRDLTTTKIGSLMKITAQVTRTHPVHPELVSATFTCLECQTVIKNIQQQFKFTQVMIHQLLNNFVLLFFN